MADTSSLFAAGPLPTLRDDTDAFHVRLREMNREMQDILGKSDQRRAELQRWHVAADLAPVAARPSPGGGGGGNAGERAQTQGSSWASAVEVTAELKQWIAEQVKSYGEMQLPDLVAALVDQQVRRHLQRLTSTVESVRSTQEELKVAVNAVSGQWEEKQTRFAAAIARVESTTRSTLRDYQSDTEAYTRKWLEELGTIRDSVSEMERKYRLVEQRTTQRLEDLSRSHHEAVSSSLSEMERHVQGWKTQLDAVVREHAGAMRTERDTVEGHVARLQGTLDSVSQALAAHASDIRSLMDGAVAQNSHVRSCRRDVNRLEMLVQSAAAGLFTDASPGRATQRNGGAAFLEGLQQHADNPTAGLLLTQELSGAKEQISFLSGRLEGLERHMHQMETAILSISNSHIHEERRSTGRYIAEHSYASRDSRPVHPQATTIHNASSYRSTDLASPTASTRRPSMAPAMMNPATPFSSLSNNTSNLPSTTASQLRSQQQQQQQQQQQRQMQMQRQQNPSWHAYPPGMSQSEERPKQIVVGGSGSSSYVGGASASSPMSGGQPQHNQQQRSGFFAAAVGIDSTGPGASQDGPLPTSVSSTVVPHPSTQAQKAKSPPQRRPLPTVLEVEEGEEEEPNVRVESSPFRVPLAAETGEASQRSAALTSPLYSMLSGKVGGDDDDGYVDQPGRSASAGNGAEDEDEDEGSYVSRPESRDREHGTRSIPSDSSRAPQWQHSGQYRPAPTSDSESERENQNLSRFPID